MNNGGCDTETVGKRASSWRIAAAVIGLSVLPLTAIGWTVQSGAMRVVIIGDSTVQTYTAGDPLRG